MLFACGYAKELITKLLPMPTFFIEVLLCDVWDIYQFISRFFTKLPNESIQDVSKNCAFWSPERKSCANEIGKGKEVKFAAQFLVVSLLCFLAQV